MITNFYEQYDFTKESILEAIKKENNVVLFGTGPNVKSYLMNEMKSSSVTAAFYFYNFRQLFGSIICFIFIYFYTL
jgi:hypothetical protein